MAIDGIGEGNSGIDLIRQLERKPETQKVQETSVEAEKVDTAKQASAQQDRGEQWASYANKAETQVPLSVEELAKQEASKKDAQEQEQKQIRAQELLNQMQLQSGRFRG